MSDKAKLPMDRNASIYRVTLYGGIVNVLLLGFKFAAGITGHSAAMVADAVHSLSDLVTDVVVLVFVHVSGRPSDRTHNYGHGKYETLALTAIGATLLVVSAGIVYGGLTKILSWAHGARLDVPGTVALWAAVASILLKEGIFRYTLAEARQHHSPALEANAWHHRSDALSSVGTALGIGAAVLLGSEWAVLDPIASVIVGLFITKVALRLLAGGVGDLMEHSLPADVQEEILRLVASVPGISEPHDLHTRRIGSIYAIELHVLVDGDVPLREAHGMASEAETLLRNRYGAGTHIVIHVEPR